MQVKPMNVRASVDALAEEVGNTIGTHNLPSIHYPLGGQAQRVGLCALRLNVAFKREHKYMTHLRTFKSGALHGMDPLKRTQMRREIAFLYRRFRQVVSLERLRLFMAIHGLDGEVNRADA